jgi:hypothetical protein
MRDAKDGGILFINQKKIEDQKAVLKFVLTKIGKNILSGKIRFSSSFDADAKSIVRHLVEHDLSKRYGNLKNGIKFVYKFLTL